MRGSVNGARSSIRAGRRECGGVTCFSKRGKGRRGSRGTHFGDAVDEAAGEEVAAGAEADASGMLVNRHHAVDGDKLDGVRQVENSDLVGDFEADEGRRGETCGCTDVNLHHGLNTAGSLLIADDWEVKVHCSRLHFDDDVHKLCMVAYRARMNKRHVSHVYHLQVHTWSTTCGHICFRSANADMSDALRTQLMPSALCHHTQGSPWRTKGTLQGVLFVACQRRRPEQCRKHRGPLHAGHAHACSPSTVSSAGATCMGSMCVAPHARSLHHESHHT
jgi:hypothetical protein